MGIGLLLWSVHADRLRRIDSHVRATMAERTRVAQEIHDTLLQSAAGAAMQIRAGLKMLHKGLHQPGVRAAINCAGTLRREHERCPASDLGASLAGA